MLQRGDHKQQVFFEEDDYQAYIDMLAPLCSETNIRIWAYLMMPNHVHLVLATDTPVELRKTIGRANCLYRRRINFRKGLDQRLWQDQMLIFSLRKDEQLLTAAARYIELEPVGEGLAAAAEDYPWSSARAHLAGRDDGLVAVEPLLSLVPDWEKFLLEGGTCAFAKRFRSQERKVGMFQRLHFAKIISRMTGRRSSFRPA